jgi:hypothetical protein
MTLEEIETMPSTMLLASDVAGYLHIDAQDIREQARSDPSKLGFPVIVAGSRLKIPKEAFVKFMKGA